MLHTHSHEPARAQVLDSIVGFKDLDGLSLQVDQREGAAEIVQNWRSKAQNSGHPWLITMDEIGMWHTGALSDSLDPHHHTLRRYVLWGTLLSGAAGVEWYFGARNQHNDLTSEDWRRRDRLWQLTNYAITFFNEHLPYWQMHPEHHLINSKDAYCLSKTDEIYAIYLPSKVNYSLDLGAASGEFSVQWYDPLSGGDLQTGSKETLAGGDIKDLGAPPATSDQDWVVLVKKVE